jgi:hypothetical protein
MTVQKLEASPVQQLLTIDGRFDNFALSAVKMAL